MISYYRQCSLLVLVLTGFATLPGPAEAQICQPGRTAQIFVGDTASDAACHFNDIQSALNSVGNCPTQVNVTRMHIWNNQHLSTGGKNVTLQGWGDGVTCFTLSQSCQPTICPIPTSTAPLVTLNGSNSNGRVLTISGAASVVTLRHLIITGGAAGGGDGGGIGFSGTGRLNLFTSAVNYNNAGYGGGINFKGTGATADSAVLTLLNESLIIGNTASVSGGGIRIEGRAQLIAENPRTYIAFNSAVNGFGGGIEVIGPAEAYVGSPGYNGAPVVHQNEAHTGGGIAVIAGEGNGLDAYLHLYSKDPAQPVAISGNAAANVGGGLYARPHYDDGGLLGDLETGDASIVSYGARIDDNSAPDGAIAYLDDEPNSSDPNDLAAGSFLRVADDPPPRGAPTCPAQTSCTRMRGNKTRTPNAVPVPTGSLIAVGRNSQLVLKRAEVTAGEAGMVLRLDPVNANIITGAVLLNCLIADNSLALGVLRQSGGGYSALRVTGCTIAGNSIASGPVVFSHDGNLHMTNSIFAQSLIPTLDYFNDGPFNEFILEYLLSNSTETLPQNLTIIQGLPKFINAAAGNYRLRHDSLGIDFAPGVASQELDLEGNPRVVDLAGIFNHFGPRDLGAYERVQEPPPEVIHADGFETGTTSSAGSE